MKKQSNSHWFVVVALVALALPVTTLNAQGGRGGGGGVGNNPAPTSPVTGNAANGKPLYFSYGCYACHGYNGETGARPFVGRWGNLATEDGFIRFLRGRANVAPITPSTSMPNFGEGSLPDKQAKDIYAYIRTFKSSAPELKDIPTLNTIIDASKQEKK
ncbi:MAG TPA: cytochrome c [Bryobacteraceae bacterium]|nr:cytochrome c [Bryobacteraceae bacterium]